MGRSTPSVPASCFATSISTRPESGVRAGTMGAEDVLHDLGLIAITSSDAQGMGRAEETVRRTFAMAAKMKAEFGPLAGDPADGRHDNARVLRYVAKLTINPAIAHGMAHEIGSTEPGKLADIVLWRPEYFGAKPQLVLKAGFPAYGVVGDPNAATDSSEPLVLGPQFGAHGATAADLVVLSWRGASLRDSLLLQEVTIDTSNSRVRATTRQVEHGDQGRRGPGPL